MGPAGFVSAESKVTAWAEELPLLINEIEGDPEISVDGGLLDHCLGMNSTHRSSDLEPDCLRANAVGRLEVEDKYAF